MHRIAVAFDAIRIAQNARLFGAHDGRLGVLLSGRATLNTPLRVQKSSEKVVLAGPSSLTVSYTHFSQ